MKHQTSSPEDCGCAPTPDELQAFRSVPKVSENAVALGSRTPFSRRMALGLGGLGILGLGTAGTIFASSAFADDYPSWDDVERARGNEAAKAQEISRIEGLIQSLESDVAAKQAEAQRLASEYFKAQEAYETAAADASSLQEQADAEAARAKESASKLGRLAAQQYRSGGDDASLELFFSGSAATADDLLAKLGTMDRLVAANQSVYADAVSARDNAQNLSNRAQVARDERDRLKKEAEKKMIAAQDAANQAKAALDTQTANRVVLEAQLAALKDDTANTVAGYEAGVEARRKAEEARLAAEAAARAAAAEEAARRAAEEAANAGNGGGGGGGGGESSGSGGSGGTPGTGGWVRPGSGGITSWFGNRGTICSNGYCTSGHRGLDFGTGCWGNIYAAAAGTVVFAAYADAWGNYIKIDHGGGVVTGYAHIANGGYNVNYGDYVGAGQVIAYAGNTGVSSGCHLHFEVYLWGERVDPAPFLYDRGINVY